MSRTLSGEAEEEENPLFKTVAFHNEQAALFRRSADKELKLAHQKLGDGDMSGVDHHLRAVNENIHQAKEHLHLSAQAIEKARSVIR